MHLIGLCDCNNFFVSCERVFRPDLNGKPVMVLSNNDGCVVARSNEVKALGIKMGTPLFEVKNLMHRHNISVFSSNYQLYGDMSNRVISILRESVPNIEVYSIDEAFLDMSEVPFEGIEQRGRELSKRIKKFTGIPVSIGIAPTKTLAKIASKLCKQYPKLDGCCLMYRPQDIEKVLKKYPIEDVWGIGRRFSKRLKMMGIITAWDFVKQSEILVHKVMGVGGVRTWRELQSEPCIDFEDVVRDRQQVCVSRSFAKEITNIDDLDSAISTFTTKVAAKLRSSGLCAGELKTFILTNRFKEDMPQSFSIKTTLFEVATNDTIEMIKASTEALKSIFKRGYGYKKAGVVACSIVPSNAVQNSLFAEENREQHRALMEVIDKINIKEGYNTIRVASQGEMDDFSSRSNISPRRTTQWSEILEIKC